MYFWRKRLCQIDKRKSICVYFSASVGQIFDCTASHLLRIAHFSLIGRVSQTHTSSATVKFLLSWHLRYEAKLLTSLIPSKVVCLFFLFLSSVVLPLLTVIEVWYSYLAIPALGISLSWPLNLILIVRGRQIRERNKTIPPKHIL